MKTSGSKSRIDNSNDTDIKEITYCEEKEPVPPTDPTDTKTEGPDVPVDPNDPAKDPEDYEGEITI